MLGENSSGRFLLLFIAGCFYLLISACSLADVSSSEVRRQWHFVDLKGGSSAFLSYDELIFVVAGQGESAVFCRADAEYHCFSTSVLEFAVPKDVRGRNEWHHEGRAYCVTQTFDDPFSSRLQEGKGLVIFSRLGLDCDGQEPFDHVAVYSEVHGLRLIFRQFESGGAVEIFSTDRIGFGAVETMGGSK